MKFELASLPGLVCQKDRESNIVDCNPHFASHLGFASPNDLIGQTPENIAWNNHAAERIIQTDKLVITNSAEHTGEEIYKHANGDIVKFFTSKQPLLDDDGNVIGLLCLCHDITFIKTKQIEAEIEREKAEAANKAKSAFLACMSHDLRTPLNAINGMAQILRTQNLIPTHAEFVNDILASCLVLKSLIEDILNLSKIESNQLEFAEEPIDLRLLANDVISQLSFLADQKNIALVLAYNDEVPRFLIGDSRRIRQILMNLIGNAIKFTHDGQILLAIEPIKIDADSVEFQIAVEDSGIGIPQERISSVFEKFYQVETFQKHEGTGLGLSIVEHLVSKMDGKIQVNSQLGKGSIFWCSLKLKRQVDTRQRAEWEDVANQFMVLVVDNQIRRAEQLERLIGTDNIVHADQEISLSLLQNQNQEKPFLIIMLHESILAYDTDFIDTFLLQHPDQQPKFLVYGELTDHKLFDNKTVDEFISTPIDDTELIGVMLALYKKFNEENASKTVLKFKSSQTPKILLVEDNPINQKVIRIMLSNQGCNVEVASNGQQAKDHAHSNGFDLIFMDLGLPDITGLEVTRNLYAEGIFNTKTPIIALTGHVSEEDKTSCFDAGMADFLTKPINEHELLQVLIKYLT